MTHYEFKPTHYGKFLGVPVLIDMTEPECPGLKARYFLDPVMDVMEFLFGIYCTIMSMVNPEFEPMFPIHIRGEYE